MWSCWTKAALNFGMFTTTAMRSTTVWRARRTFGAGNERLTLTGGMFLLLAPGVHHYTIYEPQIPKRYAVFVFSPSAATASRGKCRCAEAEDDFVTEALSQLEGRGYFIGKEQFGSRAVLSTLHQEIVHPSAGTA